MTHLQLMVLADFLWPVLDAGAPNVRVLQLLDHGLVDLVAEVLNHAVGAVEHHGLVEVRQLALRLGVHSDEVQVLPAHLHQPIQVPLVVGAHLRHPQGRGGGSGGGTGQAGTLKHSAG
jgi:hypothetical protein